MLTYKFFLSLSPYVSKKYCFEFFILFFKNSLFGQESTNLMDPILPSTCRDFI